MKSLVLALSLLFVGVTFAQKSSKVSLTYQFKNIQDGYDHNTKTVVFIDGAMVAESSQHPQSKATTIKFTCTRGNHQIKIVNMTFYEGKWEERSIANGYSTEGTIEREILFMKKKTIKVTFDLNQPDPEVSM